MKVALALFFLPTIFAINYNRVFTRYKLKYGKNYTTPEKAGEAKAFISHCAYENMLHNNAFYHGDTPFLVGLNEFSDVNLTELRSLLCPPIHPPQIFIPILNISVDILPPASRDYSSFLQPIVNQGSCGSCWAFASVAQLESIYLRNMNSFSYKFSAQYLMDCNRNSPNNGCYGGWPTVAMDFIVANGIPLGSSYCYQGIQGSCRSPIPSFVFPRFGRRTVQYSLKGDEEQLKTILATQGPVVVVMYASTTFMRYRSGIFYDNECPPGCSNYNHAVLLIGYGTDSSTGLPYWSLRNSWGTRWGEAGYFRMLRNGSNYCSISCYAMYLEK